MKNIRTKQKKPSYRSVLIPLRNSTAKYNTIFPFMKIRNSLGLVLFKSWRSFSFSLSPELMFWFSPLGCAYVRVCVCIVYVFVWFLFSKISENTSSRYDAQGTPAASITQQANESTRMVCRTWFYQLLWPHWSTDKRWKLETHPPFIREICYNFYSLSVFSNDNELVRLLSNQAARQCSLLW